MPKHFNGELLPSTKQLFGCTQPSNKKCDVKGGNENRWGMGNIKGLGLNLLLKNCFTYTSKSNWNSLQKQLKFKSRFSIAFKGVCKIVCM